MKKAYFLLASALVGVASAGAAEHFFSPEGAGSKDGTSWENAADGSTLAARVKAAKAGDGFYLRAGTYTPGTLTVPAGVSIRGGYGDAYSGTETHIAYPSLDETILSADTDGNGVGDNAAKAFITLSYSALPSNSEAVVLAGLTVRDAVYTGTSNYAGSAVYGKNANAEFDHVRFIGNSRNTGGGAVTLLASQTYFHDCIFRDNKGTNAGVALHIRDNSKTIVNRCEFSDNAATANNPQYGGAIGLADNGGTLYMANSTVTGSHIYCAGAGIRAGGKTTFYSLFNTWFDNTCNFATRYNGAAISVGAGGKFYSMGDIVVNEDEGKEDNGTNSFALVFVQDKTNEFHSGGYNVWASLTNNSTDGVTVATDDINKANTIATVFGDNRYTDLGYTRTIAPDEKYRTISLTDIAVKAAEWNIPEQLDLLLDQTGRKRSAMTVPGAYDSKGTAFASSDLFFSPEGDGTMDGSSWDDAMPADRLPYALRNLRAGHSAYLKAGVYPATGLYIPAGVTVKGGYSEECSGVETAISYPSPFETILTADIDGDGIGDNGASPFITLSPYSSATNPAVLAGLTVSDAVYTGASSYAGSAIYGNKAFAELDHLRIVNNNRNTGGGAVTLVGAEAYIHDCIFRDNKGTNAGVALHMRDNGKTIVARCEFSDNEATANNPQYGGALALADNGGTLYMANNTITGSHIYCAGAGIRAGGNTTFYSMFNTWFDNTCNFATRYSGAVISVGTGARFHSMGDIVVNKDEGKADNGTSSFAHVFIQAASNEFHSGGHNIWTSVTNNSETGTFHDTDNINMAHTIATVFGENSYTDFGYSRVIVPLESYRTVPVDDIAAKAAEWNLPAQLDVTLDQAGNKRTAMTVPGAFDVSNFITTGIADAAAADRFAVRALGAKRFAVEGVEGAVAVYDLSGRKVSAGVVSAGSVLDLNSLASGVYILYADGKSAKIAI